MHKSHSFSVLVIVAMLTLAGFAFVPLLSIRLQPSPPASSVSVTTRWDNASPEIMEQQVTSVLEGAFNTLSHIHKISSVSNEGVCTINLKFDKYAPADQMRFELASVIRRVYPALPQGVSYPQIQLERPDEEKEKPLLSYSLNGPVVPLKLQQYAESVIKKKLSFIDGIEHIEVYGASPFEWKVIYHPGQMTSLGLQPADIQTAIENYFHSQSLGFALSSDSTSGNEAGYLSVRLKEATDSVNWGAIPIKKIGQRIVYLREIGKVEFSSQSPDAYFRINGLNAINIVIYPVSGANTLRLSRIVKAKIAEIIPHLPSAYHLFKDFDSTLNIKAELNTIFYRTLFTVFILLLFVMIISLSFRYLLVVFLSILANISISFMAYYFLHVDIHLYSLAGITISLGLIIDNTIVMIDHVIHRHNLRVFLALLASTLTTIAALSVIYLLPEKLAFNVWDFASVVIINLTVSLLIALFFIPALLDFITIKAAKKKILYRRRKRIVIFTKIYEKVIMFLEKHKKWALTLIILAFGLPVFLLPNKIENKTWYAKLYNTTLGSEWYLYNAKPYVNKVLGGSLWLFSNYVFENSHSTKPQETILYVDAAMPKGATIEQINTVFEGLEQYVKQFSGVRQIVTTIKGPQFAEMAIYFTKSAKEGSLPYILKNKLTARSIDLGGMSWRIYGVGKGFSLDATTNNSVDYKLVLYGYNYDELSKQVNRLKEKLLENPRIRKINTFGNRYWWEEESLYGYHIKLNKEKVSFYGFSLGDIYGYVCPFSMSSGLAFNVLNNTGYERIRILPANLSSSNLWQIFHSPFDNNRFKLKDFASIVKEKLSPVIYKENQNYLRVVSFQYLGDKRFGKKYVNKLLNKLNTVLPLGYKAMLYSYNFDYKREGKQYGYLILVVILLIFIICSILFESLKQSLAIILVIPWSFAGIFFTFYYFDLNFDQGGYASFIMLSGLVVNSAIYIMNGYNNLIKDYQIRKLSSLKLYLKAYNEKIVPILLTILSTILGLLPFVVYGRNEVFWFALAAGTIGGLLFSLIIIVFYLPLLILKREDG